MTITGSAYQVVVEPLPEDTTSVTVLQDSAQNVGTFVTVGNDVPVVGVAPYGSTQQYLGPQGASVTLALPPGAPLILRAVSPAVLAIHIYPSSA